MYETVSSSTASTSAERANPSNDGSHSRSSSCCCYYCYVESVASGLQQRTRVRRASSHHKGDDTKRGCRWTTRYRCCCRSRAANIIECDSGEQEITSPSLSTTTSSSSSSSLAAFSDSACSNVKVVSLIASSGRMNVDDRRPTAVDIVQCSSGAATYDRCSPVTETTMMTRRCHHSRRRSLQPSSPLCDAEEKRRRRMRTWWSPTICVNQPHLQRRSLTLSAFLVLDGLFLLALLAIIPHASSKAAVVANRNHAQTAPTASGRCYSLGPGITIHGAEYRRDYGTDRKICAEVCQYDSCCMAYEWEKEEGMCTLKSRSLNGSVVRTSSSTFFGLCLDYSDAERDRFWDHVITGPLVGSVGGTARGKCADICADSDATSFDTAPPTADRTQHRKRAAAPVPPLIYNWRSDDARDADAELGTCECVAILQSVRLSFGSFSGFLV